VRPRGADKLAATLREHREDAKLYRTLATVVTDAPLPDTKSLRDLEWKGVPAREFEALCDRLGLTTLKKRPKRWAE
jgi:5'-3' exonuclease